jgi:hypothetical protein
MGRSKYRKRAKYYKEDKGYNTNNYTPDMGNMLIEIWFKCAERLLSIVGSIIVRAFKFLLS